MAYNDQVSDPGQRLSLADLIALREDNVEPGVTFAAPQNYIRNERTGAVTGLDQYQQQQAGPALDYSSPIEFGGMGKGAPPRTRSAAIEEGHSIQACGGDPTQAVLHVPACRARATVPPSDCEPAPCAGPGIR